MRTIGNFLIPLLFILTVSSMAIAAERILNVIAEVDSEEVGLLDNVTLTVTVEAENIKRAPKPELPDLKNFSIINESSRTQTSLSIINGKASRRKIISFTYLMKPEKKGTFTIDPVKIRYGGDTFKTDPIILTVVEGTRKGDDTTTLFHDGKPVDVNALKKDIFVNVEPGKSELMEGEQLFLTYRLFSRLDIDSISLKQNPGFPGFYIEDVYNATRLDYQKETVEGRSYTTSLIKKVALFPLKPGTYSPDPLVLEATVIVKSDDLFDVFGRPFTFDIKSSDFQISVKSIPPFDGEIDFSGIVGKLEATLSTPVYTARTGESMVCYLTLKSTGNLNIITDPGITLSKRGRVYLSDSMRNTVEEDKVVYFIKKYEYTIIPEESGKLGIGTADLLYFDTEDREYILMKVEPVQLSITGEDIIREKSLRGERKSFEGKTLHFIKKNVKTMKSSYTSALQTYLFFVYHIALIAAATFLVIFIMKREKIAKNEGLFKMRRARASALEILEKAKLQIERNNPGEAVNAVYRALTGYVADRARRLPQEITGKTVSPILNLIPGMTSDVIEDFISLFDTCMMLKFSTEGPEDEQRIRDLRYRSVGMINQIEDLVTKNNRAGT
jgi:hypothetical protein